MVAAQWELGGLLTQDKGIVVVNTATFESAATLACCRERDESVVDQTSPRPFALGAEIRVDERQGTVPAYRWIPFAFAFFALVWVDQF